MLKEKGDAWKLDRDREKSSRNNWSASASRVPQVFHDVSAAGFNLDHVMISAHGIYAIERRRFRRSPRQRRPRGDEWVLEPKALPPFIENAPKMIAPSDMTLAADHLSRMCGVGRRRRRRSWRSRC